MNKTAAKNATHPLAVKVPFGKYKGRLVYDVLNDPKYLAWLMQKPEYRFYVAVHKAIRHKQREAKQ